MENNKRLLISLSILLGLGLFFRILISLLPVNILIEKVMVDDGFYYLQIAKKISAGCGPTFDGKTLTNGFHPVWALILAALDYKTDLDVPVHISLIFLSVFNTVTGYLAYKCAQKLTKDNWISLFCCACWLFNPIIIFTSLNGTETALATMSLAAVCYYYLKIRETQQKIGQYFILGGIVGLACLTRSDSVFLFFSIGLDFLIIKIRRKDFRRVFTEAFAAAISFLMVISPWLIWNWIKFKTIRQISGVIIPYTLHTSFKAQGPALTQHITHIIALIGKGLAVIVYMLGAGDLILIPSGQIILICLTLLFLTLWIKSRHTSEKFWSCLNLPFIYIYTGAIFIYYTTYHWYIDFRYFLSIIYLINLYGCILIGKSIKIVIENKSDLVKKSYTFGGAFIILIIFLYSFSLFWKHGRAPHQIQHYQAVDYLNRALPENVTIGSWNAGIIGYYYKGDTVNLDGVVNNSIFGAIKKKAVMDFILENKIAYLCDSQLTFEEESFFLGKGWEEHIKPFYKITPTIDTNFIWSRLKWTKKRMESPFLIYKVE